MMSSHRDLRAPAPRRAGEARPNVTGAAPEGAAPTTLDHRRHAAHTYGPKHDRTR